MDAGTGTGVGKGVGSVNKILSISASGAAQGMATSACLLHFRGRDNVVVEVAPGCAVATPSCRDLSEEGELE